MKIFILQTMCKLKLCDNCNYLNAHPLLCFVTQKGCGNCANLDVSFDYLCVEIADLDFGIYFVNEIH